MYFTKRMVQNVHSVMFTYWDTVIDLIVIILYSIVKMSNEPYKRMWHPVITKQFKYNNITDEWELSERKHYMAGSDKKVFFWTIEFSKISNKLISVIFCAVPKRQIGADFNHETTKMCLLQIIICACPNSGACS